MKAPACTRPVSSSLRDLGEGCAVRGCPRGDGFEDGDERDSCLGDVVFDPRRDLVELRSRYEAVALQFPELASQGCRSHRTHSIGKLVESGLAVTAEAVEDSGLPSAADNARERGQRLDRDGVLCAIGHSLQLSLLVP